MVARWAEWAIGVGQTWPDDVREAPFDRVAQGEAVRLAEQTAAIEPDPGTSSERWPGGLDSDDVPGRSS